MNITQLCNKALANLGEGRITDYHESSVLAEFCRTHYEFERDSLLRMHRWNFARDRAELSRLTPDPPFEWAYRYQLPADCLRVLELNGVDAGVYSSAFSIEQKELLTNSSQAQIIYTKRVTDPNLYDSLFVEVFAFKLAAALCQQVKGSTSEKGALLQMGNAVLSEAGFVDAVEDRPKVIPPWRNSRILQARY